METNYQIWIGYHAILQEQQDTGGSVGLDEIAVEQLRENERQIVASVQVKQSIKAAELAEAKLMVSEAKV